MRLETLQTFDQKQNDKILQDQKRVKYCDVRAVLHSCDVFPKKLGIGWTPHESTVSVYSSH